MKDSAYENIRKIRFEWYYVFRDYVRNYLYFAHMNLDKLVGFWFLRHRFYRSVGYWPSFSDPKSFNEKINWRKINDRAPIYNVISDKLRLKEYISYRLGPQIAESILPTVLCITAKPTSAQLRSFGTGVAIKPNHGSHWVEIIPKDSDPDWDLIAFKARGWLRKKYGLNKHEWAYHKIEPKVFIEELVLNEDGDPAMDVKFHIMGGVCEWLDVAYNRHKAAGFVSATRDWQKLDVTWKKFTQGDLPSMPSYIEKIRAIAEEIGKDFDYIRVDFLCGAKQWKLNELTLYEGSGFIAYDDYDVDLHRGNLWKHKRNELMIS